MKFIRVHTARFKKKAMTLVELVIAMSVMSILVTSVLATYSYFLKNCEREAAMAREKSIVSEAFRYMESEIKIGNKAIVVEENRISLYRNSDNSYDNKIDYIQRDGDRLVIKYYEYGFYKSTNTFLRNIMLFRAKEDMGMIILEIVTEGGCSYKKCLDFSVK